MAKSNFSEINVRAAAIAGGILGFLCWLLVIPYGLSGYGMMGNMMGYGIGTIGSGTYTMMDVFHNYSLFSIVIDVALGAIAGIAIALAYNWALKLK